MVDVQLSDAEKTFIIHGVQDNLREDGRGCEDYRHMEIVTSVVSNTSGSAKIRLANTEVLVGVKAELGEPHPGRPDNGRLEFFVDWLTQKFWLVSKLNLVSLIQDDPTMADWNSLWTANATPEFEGRGGEELATEISSMLARAYDCPSCLDLRKLCVVAGKQCWVIYVDVLLLECGGNLFDAASIAVKAALFNTCIPTLIVTQDEGHTELELSDDPYDVQRLDVSAAPCIVTLNKIGQAHVVDASQKEEASCLARLILGVTDKGTVTAMKKEGSGSLCISGIEEMLETGKRVGQALNKSLMEVLSNEDKVGKKKFVSGFLR